MQFAELTAQGNEIKRLCMASATKEEFYMNNSAWKAVQSVAMVTGYEVPGRSNCNNSAWKAVRLWQCIKCMSYGVVPSRHIVLSSPIRALRARLPSLRSVVPSRHCLRPQPTRKNVYLPAAPLRYIDRIFNGQKVDILRINKNK